MGCAKRVFIAMISIFFTVLPKNQIERKSDRDSLEYLLRKKRNFLEANVKEGREERRRLEQPSEYQCLQKRPFGTL